MEIPVAVTQQDIDEAEHCLGVYDECPVARALQRLGFTRIDVDANRILLSVGTRRYVYQTPRLANIFIDEFDAERAVQPFDFVLECPKIATVDDERKPVFKC